MALERLSRSTENHPPFDIQYVSVIGSSDLGTVPAPWKQQMWSRDVARRLHEINEQTREYFRNAPDFTSNSNKLNNTNSPEIARLLLESERSVANKLASALRQIQPRPIDRTRSLGGLDVITEGDEQGMAVFTSTNDAFSFKFGVSAFLPNQPRERLPRIIKRLLSSDSENFVPIQPPTFSYISEKTIRTRKKTPPVDSANIAVQERFAHIVLPSNKETRLIAHLGTGPVKRPGIWKSPELAVRGLWSDQHFNHAEPIFRKQMVIPYTKQQVWVESVAPFVHPREWWIKQDAEYAPLHIGKSRTVINPSIVQRDIVFDGRNPRLLHIDILEPVEDANFTKIELHGREWEVPSMIHYLRVADFDLAVIPAAH